MVLGMVKMKTRSLARWLYTVLCARNLESTSLKIGETTKIGTSINITIWKLPTYCLSKNLFMRGFIMDGNFQVEHMKMRNPQNDVPLSDGTAFMVRKELYESHLKSATEWRQVSSVSRVSTGIRSCSKHLTEVNVP